METLTFGANPKTRMLIYGAMLGMIRAGHGELEAVDDPYNPAVFKYKEVTITIENGPYSKTPVFMKLEKDDFSEEELETINGDLEKLLKQEGGADIE